MYFPGPGIKNGSSNMEVPRKVVQVPWIEARLSLSRIEVIVNPMPNMKYPAEITRINSVTIKSIEINLDWAVLYLVRAV